MIGNVDEASSLVCRTIRFAYANEAGSLVYAGGGSDEVAIRGTVDLFEPGVLIPVT